MTRYRYTDITLEFEPLDSGHMLTLEYDLVTDSPAKLPSLTDIYSEKGNLGELLMAWNDVVTRSV